MSNYTHQIKTQNQEVQQVPTIVATCLVCRSKWSVTTTEMAQALELRLCDMRIATDIEKRAQDIVDAHIKDIGKFCNNLEDRIEGIEDNLKMFPPDDNEPQHTTLTDSEESNEEE